MSQISASQCVDPATLATPDARAARYVYCVTTTGEATSLGPIGIEGREVHVVSHCGLGAVVHDGPAQAYETRDREQATGWVLAHHRVVEAAWKRWGTVLPLTFNTVIAPGEKGAQENLLAWLYQEHDSLKQKLDVLAGKAEYGVQVFWDTAHFARQVAQTDPEISKLEQEIRSQPRGLAYMYRQKLEGLLKKAVETRAALEFKDLYAKLSQCVDNARVEKTKKVDGEWPLLINLSCLVSTEQYPDLKAELDKVKQAEGLSVRLAGPWPPYSFC